MYIDPQTLSWIIIGAASICAGMIGYKIGQGHEETTIANTITYLAENGFVRSFYNENDELELIKLNEDKPNGSTENSDEA